MKAKGTHETCIEQMQRLFATRLYTGGETPVDEAGRVRVDDWEMQTDIQEGVKTIWPQVTTENIAELTDIAGYQEEFLRMFGFGFASIDYDAECEPHRQLT